MPSNVSVHFGCRVNTVSNVPGKAVLTYTCRKPSPEGGEEIVSEETMEGDVIIGADGVKSVIRTTMGLPSAKHAYPSLKENLPPASYRYTGTYCYRGLIPMEVAKQADLIKDEENTITRPRMWFGPGKHILIFPINQASVSVFSHYRSI